ncbi:Oxygen-dependent choline dehydrogenase [Streptomyces hirsutus]
MTGISAGPALRPPRGSPPAARLREREPSRSAADHRIDVSQPSACLPSRGTGRRAEGHETRCPWNSSVPRAPSPRHCPGTASLRRRRGGRRNGGVGLAARLSEDPDRDVLVVDAGPLPRGPAGFGPALLDGLLVPGAQPNHPATSAHPVCLTPTRPWLVPRGRVLGGSSTVNGGYFVRARREDFDRWAAAGNPAWSYERVLPFLRALENDLDHGDGPLHGDRGPMRIRRGRPDHPAAAAFRDAAHALGFPDDPDKNDQAPPGFGPVPSNVIDGVRRNAGLSDPPPRCSTAPTSPPSAAVRPAGSWSRTAVPPASSSSTTAVASPSTPAPWCSAPAPSSPRTYCNCPGSDCAPTSNASASPWSGTPRPWAPASATTLRWSWSGPLATSGANRPARGSVAVCTSPPRAARSRGPAAEAVQVIWKSSSPWFPCPTS